MNIAAVLVAVQCSAVQPEPIGPGTSGPAGLGKALPKQASKSCQSAASKEGHVSALCQRLASLLQADDDCRVYVRDSQGLASLLKLLSQVGHRLACWSL